MSTNFVLFHGGESERLQKQKEENSLQQIATPLRVCPYWTLPDDAMQVLYPTCSIPTNPVVHVERTSGSSSVERKEEKKKLGEIPCEPPLDRKNPEFRS